MRIKTYYSTNLFIDNVLHVGHFLIVLISRPSLMIPEGGESLHCDEGLLPLNRKPESAANINKTANQINQHKFP